MRNNSAVIEPKFPLLDERRHSCAFKHRMCPLAESLGAENAALRLGLNICAKVIVAWEWWHWD